MPAKEEKQPEAQALEAPRLVAPVEVPPAPQAFHTEGDLPAVEQGGPTPMTATASQLAFAEKPKADTAAIDHGMFQPEEYKHACEASATRTSGTTIIATATPPPRTGPPASTRTSSP